MTTFAITITIDGTRHELAPTAGDLVRMEREFDMPASALTEETARTEHVMFLAWCAAKRTGLYADEFDAFLDHADTANRAGADTSGNDLPPPA